MDTYEGIENASAPAVPTIPPAVQGVSIEEDEAAESARSLRGRRERGEWTLKLFKIKFKLERLYRNFIYLLEQFFLRYPWVVIFLAITVLIPFVPKIKMDECAEVANLTFKYVALDYEGNSQYFYMTENGINKYFCTFDVYDIYFRCDWKYGGCYCHYQSCICHLPNGVSCHTERGKRYHSVETCCNEKFQ